MLYWHGNCIWICSGGMPTESVVPIHQIVSYTRIPEFPFLVLAPSNMYFLHEKHMV